MGEVHMAWTNVGVRGQPCGGVCSQLAVTVSVTICVTDALTSFSLVFLIWEREISNVSLIRVVSQLKEAYLQLLELMTQTCNFSTQEAC